jgi:hypothetical protein
MIHCWVLAWVHTKMQKPCGRRAWSTIHSFVYNVHTVYPSSCSLHWDLSNLSFFFAQRFTIKARFFSNQGSITPVARNIKPYKKVRLRRPQRNFNERKVKNCHRPHRRQCCRMVVAPTILIVLEMLNRNSPFYRLRPKKFMGICKNHWKGGLSK